MYTECSTIEMHSLAEVNNSLYS